MPKGSEVGGRSSCDTDQLRPHGITCFKYLATRGHVPRRRLTTAFVCHHWKATRVTSVKRIAISANEVSVLGVPANLRTICRFATECTDLSGICHNEDEDLFTAAETGGEKKNDRKSSVKWKAADVGSNEACQAHTSLSLSSCVRACSLPQGSEDAEYIRKVTDGWRNVVGGRHNVSPTRKISNASVFLGLFGCSHRSISPKEKHHFHRKPRKACMTAL